MTTDLKRNTLSVLTPAPTSRTSHTHHLRQKPLIGFLCALLLATAACASGVDDGTSGTSGNSTGDASGNSGTTGNPAGDERSICDDQSPPSGCYSGCSSVSDCPVGMHCRGGSFCDAQCNSNDDCDGDLTCDTTNGRCVLDVPPTTGCNDIDVETKRQIPTIMIIADRSNSMAVTDVSGGSRVVALHEVLFGNTGTEGVVPKNQKRIQFGISAFSGWDGNKPPAGQTCLQVADVAPSLNNSSNMESVSGWTADKDASGNYIDLHWGTPTGHAVANAREILLTGGFDPATSLIVLTTDGLPYHSGCSNTPDRATAEAYAVEETKAAYDAGIKTHVIGIHGTPSQIASLQDVANAGQGVKAGDPDAEFFTATDKVELQKFFDDLIASRIPCTITLNKPVSNQSAACKYGKVSLNGNSLVCDNNNPDWRMVDDQTIELLGSSCTTWRDPAIESSLKATFPCSAFVE